MSDFKVGGELYVPIKVEIGGKEYTVKKINQKRIRETEALDAELVELKKTLDPDIFPYRKLDNTYRQLEILFDAEAHEAIHDLDFMEARKLLEYLVNTTFNPPKKEKTPEAEAEKNAPKPGDMTAP